MLAWLKGENFKKGKGHLSLMLYVHKFPFGLILSFVDANTYLHLHKFPIYLDSH